MYNKQQWLDEIPDMSRPILDGSGKQKTDPQTGRPLFELVQAGTRITSARLNNMEGGIEGAHVLIEQLAKELAGNFIAAIDGVMGLQCSTQGLTASWTAGVAYVGGRRFEVSAGNMTLNPTQGQYLYVDADGTVKKTTSQATAKSGLLLFYVATDTSGVISTMDQRVNISLEEILRKLENIEVPEASLTQKGIVRLSSATDSPSETDAATPKAVMEATLQAKSYTDQQISLVTETGIPKLVSYPLLVTATADNQKVFEIPLDLFDANTDTLLVAINRAVLDATQYTVTNTVRDGAGQVTQRAKINLVTGVAATSEVTMVVLKNVPIGPDGAINGAVLAVDSVPINRVNGLQDQIQNSNRWGAL